MDNIQRKVFWEMLCNLTGQNIDNDKLKLFNVIKYPKYLYRYRAMNLRNLEALQSNKMYFISADKYDDPFDTHITYNLETINNLLNGALSTESLDHYKHIFKQYNIDLHLNDEQFQNINKTDVSNIIESIDFSLSQKIKDLIQKQQYSACFSEDYLNETLWLKYSDNHKGFCLIYDLENKDNFLFGDGLQDCCNDDINLSLYPVYYSDEKYDATKFSLCMGVFDYLKKYNNENDAAFFMSQILPMLWEREKIALIKHKCHEYDKEWRIILPVTPEKPIYKRWRPDGIIIGLKTPIEDEVLMIRAAKFAGIKNIYRSYIDKEFNLSIRQYPNETIDEIINK